MPDLTVDNADLVVGILDSVEQIAVRREPPGRIEAKLLHVTRAVREAKISAPLGVCGSALARHGKELLTLLKAYSPRIERRR